MVSAGCGGGGGRGSAGSGGHSSFHAPQRPKAWLAVTEFLGSDPAARRRPV